MVIPDITPSGGPALGYLSIDSSGQVSPLGCNALVFDPIGDRWGSMVYGAAPRLWWRSPALLALCLGVRCPAQLLAIKQIGRVCHSHRLDLKKQAIDLLNM